MWESRVVSLSGNQCLRCVAGIALVVEICVAVPGWAASRLGGETDDSVCDVGPTYERSRDETRAGDFIRSSCRNGQVLIGASVVPAGGFESEIMRLAKANCRIADIQAQRVRRSTGPIFMEFDEVRCRIEKLQK